MFTNIFVSRTVVAANQQIYNGVLKQISCTTRTYSNRITTLLNQTTDTAELCKFSSKTTSASEDGRQQFDSIFPIIVKDITDTVKDLDIPNLTAWYTRLLEYNVSLGKKKRAFSTVLSYKLLADPQELTPEKIQLAGIIGWCTEMLGNAFVMIDDILDQSEIRHGVSCWYKLKDVGVSAVNDIVVLENCTYTVLRKYFRDRPCYLNLMELLHDGFLQISIGQTLDYLVSSSDKSNLQLFSMERYRTIAMQKLAYFVFTSSVLPAMYLAGIHDTKLHAEARAILQEMGRLVQVNVCENLYVLENIYAIGDPLFQNDFLDCFGDVISNKAALYGDIRNGKCAWPIVVALERASPEQRQILDQYYGQPGEQSIQPVMDVFRALDVPRIYVDYKEEALQNIRKQIESIDARFSKQIFYNILQMC